MLSVEQALVALLKDHLLVVLQLVECCLGMRTNEPPAAERAGGRRRKVDGHEVGIGWMRFPKASGTHSLLCQ